MYRFRFTHSPCVNKASWGCALSPIIAKNSSECYSCFDNYKRHYSSNTSSVYQSQHSPCKQSICDYVNVQEGKKSFFSFASSMSPTNETTFSHNSNAKNDNDNDGDKNEDIKKRDNKLEYKPCPRSSLFVPGSKRKALEKIKTLNADAYILDLEDSVGQGVKREARENIYDFLTSLSSSTSTSTKTMIEENEAANQKDCEASQKTHNTLANSNYRFIIRINSPDDDMANALLDLELINQLGPSCIEAVALPKVSTKTFDLIANELHPELLHSLWALFETPQSILDAAKICNSHHYRCAVMGYNDLAAELQLPSDATQGGVQQKHNPSQPEQQLEERKQSNPNVMDIMQTEISIISQLPLYYSTLAVLFASRANHMYVLDGVYNDPTSASGFMRSLRICKALGCNGKTLIHPSQIAPTNAIYLPTAEEVAWAYKIRDAVREAHGGVAVVNGKMVEQLHVRQAAQTLMLYELSTTGVNKK